MQLSYIIRRAVYSLFFLFLLATVTFFLMHAVPGGPFSGGEKPLPREIVERLMRYYHLDRPVWQQFLEYLWNIVRGDLGPSYTQRGRTVNEIIKDHLPVSAQLGAVAFLVAVFLGIPMGIIAAVKFNTFIDYFCMLIAVAGISIPAMALGPLLIYIFGVKLRVFPVAQWGTWKHMVLPAFTLGIGSSAMIARLTRASMLQVIRADFIRTARAKGLPESSIILRHALRNALIPVVTVLGPLFGALVTGTLVVEQIFSIPGLGRFFVYSITDRDYPVIMGVTLLYGAVIIIMNFVVDASYALLDPRITYD
jgi:ABC-type dipeptide/oligopeptide/nickel transport system permease component